MDGVGVGRVRTAPQGDDGGRHIPVGDPGGVAPRFQRCAGCPDRASGGQFDRCGVQPQRTGELTQLGVDVEPLAHSQVVEELGAAHAAQGAARQLALLGAQVAPQVEVGQEVARGVGEAPVHGVGRLLPVRGPLAHVLNGQGGHDHHDLPGAAQLAGAQQHAAQTRVDGQAGQASPDGRQTRPADRRAGPPGLSGDPAAAGAAAVGPAACAVGGPVDRPDLGEQGDAVAHRPRIGRIQEREVLDRAQPERRHLQDDAGQGCAQDFRFGVLRARQIVGLGVQADGDAVGHAPAAARPLIGAGPADRLDRQALDLRPVGVAGDAGQTRVDHVADAGHGQRGFGDVRGQHDPTARVRFEDSMLLGGGQTRVQGDDLDGPRHPGPSVRDVARAQVVDEGGLGVADVPLPGEEDEDVARARRHELVDGVDDPGDLVAVLLRAGRLSRLIGPRLGGAVGGRADRLAALAGGRPHRRVGGGQGLQLGVGELSRGGGARRRGGGGSFPARGVRGRRLGRLGVVGEQGAVADLDGVGASRDLDDGGGDACTGGAVAAGDAVGARVRVGRAPEVVGEALGVDGGGGDDHLEIRAGGQKPGQVAEDEIDGEAALVGLVDDDRVVATQHRVGLDLGEQDAVGHELDQGGGAGLLGEAHLVADDAVAADGGAQFAGDALGDGAGRDTPRLGVADHAGDAATQPQADFGQLGGLARPSLAGDDDDLVIADRLGDLVTTGGDRQLVGVDEGGSHRSGRDGGRPRHRRGRPRPRHRRVLRRPRAAACPQGSRQCRRSS